MSKLGGSSLRASENGIVLVCLKILMDHVLIKNY